jgi:molybdopterin converting factor small subunit
VVTIELPRVLCSQQDDKTTVVLTKSYATVGDAFAALGEQSPGVVERVIDEQGEVRRHVNIFVNDESIRFLNGLSTPAPDGSTIFVLAAVSGG